MPKPRKNRFRLAAAGMAGMMVAGSALALKAHAAGSAGADTIKDREDCPQGAAIAIPNLIEARKSGNESAADPSRGPVRKKATKKKAAKKKTALRKKATRKKATKKAVKRAPVRTRKKAAKKAAAPRRQPC